MRRVIEWVIIIAAVALLIGLLAEARGNKHFRGDEIGSHGTRVVVVHIVP
jgi:hypothetical protein